MSIWKGEIKSDCKQKELAEWEQLKQSTKLHDTVLREVQLINNNDSENNHNLLHESKG